MTIKNCKIALGLAALLLGAALPASAQVLGTVHKPPVAPTNGKPARIIPGSPKITAKAITFRMRHDRRLNGSHIRVTVYRHRVGLYGAVPNYYQRRIARQIAQSIPGITYVADHLRVLSTPLPSSQIIAWIRRELKDNPATSHETIRVEASHGVVGLSGTVGTLYAARTAIHIAKRVPRVPVVQDNLHVQSGPTGAALTNAVKSVLAADPVLRKDHLTVLSNGKGYVYLRGAVYSPTAKRRAEEVTSRVPGVTGLSNSVVTLRPGLKRYRRPTR